MTTESQASSEFFVVAGITMVILLMMGLIIYEKSTESFRFQMDISGKRIANRIADNVNQIGNVGIGYSQCFTLPGHIVDREYRVRFYPGEATVFVEIGNPSDPEAIWSAPLFTPNLECTMPLCSDVGTEGKQVNVWISYKEDGVRIRDCGECGAPSSCNLIITTSL